MHRHPTTVLPLAAVGGTCVGASCILMNITVLGSTGNAADLYFCCRP